MHVMLYFAAHGNMCMFCRFTGRRLRRLLLLPWWDINSIVRSRLADTSLVIAKTHLRYLTPVIFLFVNAAFEKADRSKGLWLKYLLGCFLEQTNFKYFKKKSNFQIRYNILYFYYPLFYIQVEAGRCTTDWDYQGVMENQVTCNKTLLIAGTL